MKSYPLHSTQEETGLIEQVKVAIDENVSSEALTELGDLDTLTLDEIIESKVEDAARLVVMEAPNELLDGGKSLADLPVTWLSRPAGAGYIVLPKDFLRLVVFQMSDWRRGVTAPVSEYEAQYLLQGSDFSGIRGNNERPVVAVTHGGGGELHLEFYSCDNIYQSIVRGLYVPRPVVTSDKRIELCERLVRPTVYRIASLTALALVNGDVAQATLATCHTLLGLDNNPNG